MANQLITGNDLGTFTDADKVLIPHTNTQDITTNLDQTGKDVAEFVVAQGHEASVGASSSPVKANASSLKYFGGGGLYWQAKDDNATGEVTDDVLIKAMRSDVIVQLDTGSPVSTSTFQNMRLVRGTVTIGASLAYHASGRVSVGHVADKANDVTLHLQSTVACPLLVAAGGNIVSIAPITSAYIGDGATLRQDTAVLAACEVLAGGLLELNHTAATTIIVHPFGTLNVSQTAKFKTITTLILMPDAILISDGEPNQAGGPTVTNLTDLRND